MSISSSIIDMLLFLSRYSINSIMIKFNHYQGHLKITMINESQYDLPRLRHGASISVPSITIFLYFIYQNDFLCVTACDAAHTFPCDQCSQPAHGETRTFQTSPCLAHEIKLYNKKYTETVAHATSSFLPHQTAFSC